MAAARTVCVIGAGYVGEQLINIFSTGYDVVAVDISPARVATLAAKYPHVQFRTSAEGLTACDAYLVSVPTLLTPENRPDLGHVATVRDTLARIVPPGALVVVESSVSVGATRELFGSFRERGVLVAMSPERVDPGRATPLPHQIPKVVSGIDAASLERVRAVYGAVYETVVPVSSLEAAEMVKLYENCFRVVNIAYINEIADVCGARGVDVSEVVAAASTKPFGFMPFFPGFGMGGHCLPVNPHYLMAGAGQGELPVLEMATALMDGRPAKKAADIAAALPAGGRVLFMGIGYKQGEGLVGAFSPGHRCCKELQRLGAAVAVYDPTVAAAASAAHADLSFEFVSPEQLRAGVPAGTSMVVVNMGLAPWEADAVAAFEKAGGAVRHANRTPAVGAVPIAPAASACAK